MRRLIGLAAAVATSLGLVAGGATAEEWGPEETRDRLMIEETMARYMVALDTADADAYGALFTEDGVLKAGDFVERGREALREYVVDLRERWDLPDGRHFGRTRHIFYNLTVDIDGDRAEAQSYWQTLAPNPPDGPWQIIATGVSEDSFVKVDGKWLFEERVIIPDPETVPQATSAAAEE